MVEEGLTEAGWGAIRLGTDIDFLLDLEFEGESMWLAVRASPKDVTSNAFGNVVDSIILFVFFFFSFFSDVFLFAENSSYIIFNYLNIKQFLIKHLSK